MSARLWGAIAASAVLHGALVVRLAPSRAPARALAFAPGSGSHALAVLLVTSGRGPVPELAAAPAALPRAAPARAVRPRAPSGGSPVAAPAAPAGAELPSGEGEGGAAAPGPGLGEGAGEGSAPGAGATGEGGGGAGSGGEGALLAELHRRLAAAARSCYPAAARRFGQRGVVRLVFALDATGAASGAALEGTTGSPLLDRAAQECVLSRAAPLPAVPGRYAVDVRFADE